MNLSTVASRERIPTHNLLSSFFGMAISASNPEAPAIAHAEAPTCFAPTMGANMARWALHRGPPGEPPAPPPARPPPVRAHRSEARPPSATECRDGEGEEWLAQIRGRNSAPPIERAGGVGGPSLTPARAVRGRGLAAA